jgi:hypothetical protein
MTYEADNLLVAPGGCSPQHINVLCAVHGVAPMFIMV